MDFKFKVFLNFKFDYEAELQSLKSKAYISKGGHMHCQVSDDFHFFCSFSHSSNLLLTLKGFQFYTPFAK